MANKWCRKKLNLLLLKNPRLKRGSEAIFIQFMSSFGLKVVVVPLKLSAL